MKVNDITRRVLRVRRERRDLPKDGWELIGEDGGKLWQLHRGFRIGYVITDCRVAATGNELWIKTRDTALESKR